MVLNDRGWLLHCSASVLVDQKWRAGKYWNAREELDWPTRPDNSLGWCYRWSNWTTVSLASSWDSYDPISAVVHEPFFFSSWAAVWLPLDLVRNPRVTSLPNPCLNPPSEYSYHQLRTAPPPQLPIPTESRRILRNFSIKNVFLCQSQPVPKGI